MIMNKLFLLTGLLFWGHFLMAQSLEIDGNVVSQEGPTTGSKVIILKNDVKIDEQTPNKRGHFDIKLSLGGEYRLCFEQPGYVTKIVNVNTEVPEEILESNPNFPPVTLIINLYPKVEGIDCSIFDQPIAILAYNHEVDDFTFDKEYSDKIKARIAETEQKIRHQLTARSAEAIEEERRFAALVSQGQQAFDKKQWPTAIQSWQKALSLKPARKELEEKISMARKEAELEEARKAVELQNAQAYRLLIAAADSLFGQKEYAAAKEKYTAALRLKAQEKHPANQIKAIDSLLAELARRNAESQKQLAQLEANYQKTIRQADQEYAAGQYEKAILTYRQASQLKTGESYPKERIVLAERELENLRLRKAREEEQKRIEAEKQKGLRQQYDKLIAEADAAFKDENYSLARLRYTEADQLKPEEIYPKKQIQAIDEIIHSAQYQARLAEYNKNKTLAEKNLQQKKYAAAKVYYQKALGLLSVDKDDIRQKLDEIDRQIEAERLAALEKEYKEHIGKADKAYQEKAYAIAKFYYQKALEIKPGDAYATKQLQEVEQNISDRKEKQMEL